MQNVSLNRPQAATIIQAYAVPYPHLISLPCGACVMANEVHFDNHRQELLAYCDGDMDFRYDFNAQQWERV